MCSVLDWITRVCTLDNLAYKVLMSFTVVYRFSTMFMIPKPTPYSRTSFRNRTLSTWTKIYWSKSFLFSYYVDIMIILCLHVFMPSYVSSLPVKFLWELWIILCFLKYKQKDLCYRKKNNVTVLILGTLVVFHYQFPYQMHVTVDMFDWEGNINQAY